jgi:hypothetical protein
MMVYFLLLVFFGLNAYLLIQNIAIKNEQKQIINKAYSLYNLDSVYGYEQSSTPLYQRINYLYEGYLKEKAQPDYTYYEADRATLKNDWKGHCTSQLRRVIDIQSRVRDIENSISTLTDASPTDMNPKLEDLIRNKRYDDSLSEMSNYYSHFLPQKDFDFIMHTTD